jgi:hypothetical protein
MVATSSLTELGQNCNTTLEGETVMMAKEQIAETYGEIRYTIAFGCSGGSMGQHAVANQFPGLLQGLLPECSFPDIWTTLTNDTPDCNYLINYFSKISPQLWPDVAAQNAVYGYEDGTSFCGGPGADPKDNQHAFSFNPAAGCDLPAAQIYSPETNPTGTRCTVQDLMVNILGRRAPSVWGPVEKKIGRGFANRMLDNVGLQYGLKALATGAISVEQFVDLNEKIQCWDIDLEFQSGRCEADRPALDELYHSGQINEGYELARVPIIDARTGANNEVHSNLNAETNRVRLLRANGHAQNRAAWYEPEKAAGGVPTPATAMQAFVVLDRWLAKVDKDSSVEPLEAKILRNKPTEAADGCVNGDQRLSMSVCAVSRVVYDDPHIVAGTPPARDILKCQLKPLRREDYDVAFSEDQWARLNKAFPTGVCDWSKPGVGQQRNIPWLTYANGPGGQPLGDPPRSVMLGSPAAAMKPACASAAGFRSVAVEPRGRGLFFDFDRFQQRRFMIEVFQQSAGRRIVHERLVVRFRDVADPILWRGRDRKNRRLANGHYFVRYTMQLDGRVRDVRRVALRLAKGRFRPVADFYQRTDCGLFRSFKLSSAAFGGAQDEPLRIALRLARPASRLRLEARSRGRILQRWSVRTAGSSRTYRFRLPASRVPRGRTVTVSATAVDGRREIGHQRLTARKI